MQICSLLHEHVDNHSCTRFLKGNVDNEPLTNPHEVNTKGQFLGLEKVHYGMIDDIGQNDLETSKRTFSQRSHKRDLASLTTQLLGLGFDGDTSTVMKCCVCVSIYRHYIS